MPAPRRHLSRILRDLGLFAWFGGGLMGNVALNGASSEVRDPRDRATVSNVGHARWAPVELAAIAAYTAGALGLAAEDRDDRPAARANNAATLALSLAAAGCSLAAGYLGLLVARGTRQGFAPLDERAPVESAVEPAAATPERAATAQRRLRVLQWTIPLCTGALIVLSARRGELEGVARR